MESIEDTSIGTSDMIGLVMVTLEVYRLVVSSGDDVPWDVVCADVEALVKGRKLDVLTSVRVL